MIASLLLLSAALADPCGMVPPAHIPGFSGTPTIERTGDQETYVFFADGIQTIAIRPGFTGSADQFGMLVPVPSAPALRKIGDATFTHLAAAVNPPEVYVTIADQPPPREYRRRSGRKVPSSTARPPESAPALKYDAVRVVNEEAVGMYEVAVLEAGSPKALERWMSKRDFKYPSGMDEVVHEYVDQGWLFVAIKAKVGQLGGVEPRPGMRDVETGLPSGATFSGHVQGMAFRFRTDEPVVPMRLSTFNGHDAQNIVYMVADRPVRLDDRSVELVKRQILGPQLSNHLLTPLKVLYQGGKASEVQPHDRAQIEQMRNQAGYNGVARNLIAADLLALHTDTLSLPFEEEEKALLNINEALGLRGEDIDQLAQVTMAGERTEALGARDEDLGKMVLTVMAGDFENAWLRENNLHFARWEMPGERNNDAAWSRGPADLRRTVYRR